MATKRQEVVPRAVLEVSPEFWNLERLNTARAADGGGDSLIALSSHNVECPGQLQILFHEPLRAQICSNAFVSHVACQLVEVEAGSLDARRHHHVSISGIQRRLAKPG